MAGLLSNEINNTEKISVFVGECKRMGITILPPDVNRSGLKFMPEAVAAVAGRGELKRITERPRAKRPRLHTMPSAYGLAAIKNVGQGAMELPFASASGGGDFKSLEDFCSRLDSRIANRKMLETLVKCRRVRFSAPRTSGTFCLHR